MKKRIISTLVTATVALTDFWGGQLTNATVQANEKTYIAVEDIIDWNTDGKELSLALQDDTEAYAYKSQNVYKPERKQFLALDEIADVKATKTGFEIITADGESYYFDRQEIK